MSVIVECLTDESGDEWFVSFYIDRAKYRSNSVRSEAQAEAMATKARAVLAASPPQQAQAQPVTAEWQRGYNDGYRAGGRDADLAQALEPTQPMQYGSIAERAEQGLKRGLWKNDEAKELHALNRRLSELLNGVANALRGPPPPGTLWSFHDLPELAAKAAQPQAQPTALPGEALTEEQIMDVPAGINDGSRLFLVRFARAVIDADRRLRASVSATLVPPHWMDVKALEVAKRFTQDTEGQRRASLQCAVVEAMQFALAASPSTPTAAPKDKP